MQKRDSEVQRLFHELADLEPPAREAYLRSSAVSHEVAAETVSLLEAADRAGDFLGALSESRPPTTGAVIAGRYRIERPLGRGAMGDVYLARDQQLERQVALKFLPAVFGKRSDGGARFVVEARAAARLDHPNVATVYDIAESEHGGLFIVMAYYSGESLRERLLAGHVAPAEACRIGSQIAAALSAAHAVGIVHRDVKPANILFDAEGAVKLADFGVAKLVGHDLTAPGAVVGTLAYMAPEQALGEVVEAQSDLWALGVVLFEMLAGYPPFAGKSAGAILHVILHHDPPPLPPDRGIPDDVRAFVAVLLERDPARRPASAEVIGRALSAAAGMLTSNGVPISRDGHEVPRVQSLLDVAWSVVSSVALPVVLTTFVGREQELRLARSLLAETRLLTFTGPGGTGKTRLALELAATMRDSYADGVCFIPLAEVSDAKLVASSVGQAIGSRDLGGAPIEARVAAALRNRRSLLILDNFEHVLGATGFVGELLAACPGISILATSRTPLGLQGEQELQIPSLDTPAPGEVNAGTTEAVQLFVQRARSARSDFVLDGRNLDAVAEICRRLDGLPLAIEMAAAWTRLLSPGALLRRLDNRLDLLRSDTRDRPERHRTMRDVINWSYTLLTEYERAYFDQLAIFSGGISLDAAQAVGERVAEAAASQSGIPKALDILASLCHKNLLRHEEQEDGEPRFFMLETIREFGLERLRSTAAETSARRAHCSYFLALAERAAPYLRGPAQGKWFDVLEREYPNLRVALEATLAAAESITQPGNSEQAATDAAHLAAALHRLWLTRGPLLEGAMFLRRAIAVAEQSAAVDPELRAQLVTDAGLLASTRSAYVEARDCFERSLALHRRLGNRDATGSVLNHLGWTMWIQGDLAAGERMSEEARTIHAEAGNDMGVALSLNNLAWIAMVRGAYARAEDYFALSLAGHRARGDQRSVAFSLSWMGLLALKRGDPARAVALHEEALAMLEPVADHGYRLLTISRLAAARHAAGEPGDHAAAIAHMGLPGLRAEGRMWPLASSLADLGLIWRDRGEFKRAQSTLEEALALRREMGSRAGVADVQILLATVLHRHGKSDRGGALLADALRDALDYGTIPTVIDGIDAAAEIAWDDDGLHQTSTYLQAAAARFRDNLGIPLAPRYEIADASLRRASEKALGIDRFAELRVAGMTLTIDSAVATAIQMLEPG